jgi:hypothetical protein
MYTFNFPSEHLFSLSKLMKANSNITKDYQQLFQVIKKIYFLGNLNRTTFLYSIIQFTTYALHGSFVFVSEKECNKKIYDYWQCESEGKQIQFTSFAEE